jgi:mannose-6-phosphate isomerase-like protein (cupin superfamily)
MKIYWIALICALPLAAADPAGFTHWTASDLTGMQKKLSAKLDGKHFASQQLERYGNHYTMVAYRDSDGEAELHEKDADLFVVESGGATLIVGGKMSNPKTTAANELRAPSIDGGTKTKIAAGDIVHIPRNTPHQLMLDGNKQITYFVMKVTE